MRNLYWKIFLSFWLATILIIVTTAWITSQISRSSSLPAHEQLFMDSYANAAVATYEAGKVVALQEWFKRIGNLRHLGVFLISNNGKIIGSGPVPNKVKRISADFSSNGLDEGILKTGKLLVSHEILSNSGTAYRLVAVMEKPLTHLIQIPWTGLLLRLSIAVFFSGLICYLLSVYLTQPLQYLRQAAQSIAGGNLKTRVQKIAGHQKDEIGELGKDFNSMAEQLESIINAKERLLGDISHELRSPLARLNIAIELGRNKTKDLAEAEFNRMETEVERLNSLIGEILSFARMNRTSISMSLDHHDIADILNHVIDDACFEFDANRRRIQHQKFSPCPAKIDRRLIHHAVENILRNALKYTPEDQSVEIMLECIPEEKKAIISILDNGPGVPDDQLEKIFTPFYRVDTSREKKTGGYGLGLAIANRAVALHMGSVIAQNRPEGGLKIDIILPTGE